MRFRSRLPTTAPAAEDVAAVPEIRAEGVVTFPSGNRQQTPVLRGCSLAVRGGGLTAIVGPSGAGKTSLLYCLSGLDRPDEGRVLIGGVDVYALSEERRTRFLRPSVGFVFQQYNLIDYLTVEENLRLPQVLARRPVSSTALGETLSRFGLLEKRREKAAALSGGEQQRVALCRALLAEPSVIFADEPTGALDTVNTGVVLRVLRDLAGRGCSVVMVTHDVESAALADRVVFLRDGAIEHVAGRLSADEITVLSARFEGNRRV
ncbi:ABC transporter ATP-binding protein [Tsukamurella pulmonis]|uniref:ABC transporter ATP-binding protein n=1 Tax=Tsukamurella pulmonis TaxID=47312 RepID=UPI0009EB12E6|nr:ABC transporter ATP-binding protein [Tsukamurella pulmonis]RDH09761.1 ABC transporter ATP-binding protein [Tsukamurella pulmonis]